MHGLKDKGLKRVLDIIVEHRSLPFLELVNESKIDEQRLQAMVEELEKLSLVEVSAREDVLKEYVTVKTAAAAASASA